MPAPVTGRKNQSVEEPGVGCGGGGGRGRKHRRNKRGGGESKATTEEQHNNGATSGRTNVGSGGVGSGGGAASATSGNVTGGSRSGRSSGGVGNKGGGSRRRHRGGGNSRGVVDVGNNGGSGDADLDPLDAQAIQEFQQWVSSPGAPDKAVEAQKNFDADGFMPRYLRQVRHFLKERDAHILARHSPGSGGSATGSCENSTSFRRGNGPGGDLNANAQSVSNTQSPRGGGRWGDNIVASNREPPPEQSGAWNTSAEHIPEDIANSPRKSALHPSPSDVDGHLSLPVGVESPNVEGDASRGGSFPDYQHQHPQEGQKLSMNQEDYSRHPDFQHQHQHQNQHQQEQHDQQMLQHQSQELQQQHNYHLEHQQHTYSQVESSGVLLQTSTFMNHQPLPNAQQYSETSESVTAFGGDSVVAVGSQSAAEDGSWRHFINSPFNSSLDPSSVGASSGGQGGSLDPVQQFLLQGGSQQISGISSLAGESSASSSQGGVEQTTSEEQWTKYFDQATGRHYWNNGKESTWEDPALKTSILQQQQQLQLLRHQQQQLILQQQQQLRQQGQQEGPGAWGYQAGSNQHGQQWSSQPPLSPASGLQAPLNFYPRGDRLTGVVEPSGSLASIPPPSMALSHEAVENRTSREATGSAASGDYEAADGVGGYERPIQRSGPPHGQNDWDQEPREVIGNVQNLSEPAAGGGDWGHSGDVAGSSAAMVASSWGKSSPSSPAVHSNEQRLPIPTVTGRVVHDDSSQNDWERGHADLALQQIEQQRRARGVLPDEKPTVGDEPSWGGWKGQDQQPRGTMDAAQVGNRSNLQAGLDLAPASHPGRQQRHQQTSTGGLSNSAEDSGGKVVSALHAQQSQAVAEHMRQTRQRQSGRNAPQSNLSNDTRNDSEDSRGGVRGMGKRGNVQQQQAGRSPGTTTLETAPSGREDDGLREGPPSTMTATLASAAPETHLAPEDKDKTKPSRVPPKRTVKNQVGQIFLTRPVGTGGGRGVGASLGSAGGFGPLKVRPSAHLTVRWELPAGVIDGVGRQHKGGDEHPRLMVGIFRLGVPSNTSGIISKRLFDRPSRPCRDPRQLLVGNMSFYAPKSVGTFVFRIYDASDPVDTLATSRAWQVDAQGKDVEHSVRFVLNQLCNTDGKGSVMGALAQLAHLLGHLEKAPPQRYNRSVGKSVWDAVTAARNQLNSVKIMSGSGEKNDGSGGSGGGGDSLDKDVTGHERKLRAVHGAVWGVLDAIICNPEAAALLADTPPQLHPADPRRASLSCVALCGLWQSTFCPFDERYYDSPQALADHYREDFGFIPSSLPLENVDPVTLNALTQQLRGLLPRLLPSADFSEKRERVRERLENVLRTQLPETMFPRGSVLRIFGSSGNGFGNDGADLDMYMEYAHGASHPEDAGELIEFIADKLQAAGLLEVDSRPTARIPIVMFKDLESGLKCDISVMNRLALRNTLLLKAYSEADVRVKELAYVVKHWAKRRWVNNASEGTLSSYGYILCLVHFLQTRSPPVVPNLQALPPDWDGRTPPGFSNSGMIPVVMTMQPTDGMPCNTYFYDPMVPGREGEKRKAFLREFGLRNRSSSGELLAGFFRYFSSEFDCRMNVVSVRLGGLADREQKAEACCWTMYSRLSIEDPFETWYDVGHVLKWSSFRQVRMEFARAYALIARSTPIGEAVGGGGDLSNLLETICTEAEAPPSSKLEECASHEGAEEVTEQLRLLDLDAHVL